MPESSLSIVVIDANEVRAAILRDGLSRAGLDDVTVIAETQNLLRQIVEIDPDVVIIDIQNPSRDVVEQMFQVSRLVARPVAMFVDRSDAGMMEAAIEAGVSAYVVDGLKTERVKAVVDLAITRFNAFTRLQRELESARNQLADRKIVERAKGILMRVNNLSESEAYDLLRRTAMKQQRKVVFVAQGVVKRSRQTDLP